VTDCTRKNVPISGISRENYPFNNAIVERERTTIMNEEHVRIWKEEIVGHLRAGSS
jgi:hypothetical protein